MGDDALSLCRELCEISKRRCALIGAYEDRAIALENSVYASLNLQLVQAEHTTITLAANARDTER